MSRKEEATSGPGGALPPSYRENIAVGILHPGPLEIVECGNALVVEDFAARWLEAWNSHEQERILALMHEDCVYEDSAWPRTMRSHADVREFLDSVWRAFRTFASSRITARSSNPTERPAAFYWRGYATHTGPLDPPGLAPTGRRIQPEGGDFHEYRDGKLARVRIAFDMADTTRQLGVLPATGSREEHLITRLAGLRAKLGRRR